jgi:hypothetical protein
MSTVAEIEDAIAKLPPAELDRLMAWLGDFKGLTGLADDLFVMMDEEEKSDAKNDAR